MEKYKNILPENVFHVITKGKTCELCVTNNNISNYTNFSNFVSDNLIVDVNYFYVIYYKSDCDGGLFVLTGGFKLCEMDFYDIEMVYNHLIESFNNSYNGHDRVNSINVSFHPYNAILLFKEYKSKIGI
jgi:hypothetical protein